MAPATPSPAIPLFEREAFREVAGLALRPGGTTLTEVALEHCVLAPGALVADIGCGRGASLSLISGRGFRPMGLDPSPQLLAEARRHDEKATLVQATAEAVPFRGGTFAAVLCECVLSITRDPRATLEEMRRILAPGGLLVLTDLYLRDPVGPGAPRTAGCAAGAVSRNALEERLHAAGFLVRVFEDHSRLLAELAGRLLFAGFDGSELGLGCTGCGRPGYFLCIAQTEAQ